MAEQQQQQQRRRRRHAFQQQGTTTRASLLLLLLMLVMAFAAGGARAVSVRRCNWVSGACGASPGLLLSALPAGIRPASPMAQATLRAYALDARCLVHADAAACAADAGEHGCAWEAGMCGVDPDWAEDALSDVPAMGGCPGSPAADVHACAALKTADACARQGGANKCAWLDAGAAAAALAASRATAREYPSAVGAPLGAAGGGGSGSRSNTRGGGTGSPAIVDLRGRGLQQQQLLAPDGGALAPGCVSARVRQLVAAADIKALDRLNADVGGEAPSAYGACEQAAQELEARCFDADDRAACGALPECLWSAAADECRARQAPLLTALFGPAAARAAAAARSCQAARSPAACAAAGSVEYDPALGAAVRA